MSKFISRKIIIIIPGKYINKKEKIQKNTRLFLMFNVKLVPMRVSCVSKCLFCTDQLMYMMI